MKIEERLNNLKVKYGLSKNDMEDITRLINTEKIKNIIIEIIDSKNDVFADDETYTDLIQIVDYFSGHENLAMAIENDILSWDYILDLILHYKREMDLYE